MSQERPDTSNLLRPLTPAEPTETLKPKPKRKAKADPAVPKYVIDYHRNGSGGAGFYTVLFTGPRGTDAAGKRMLAVRFQQTDATLFNEWPQQNCAILDLDDPNQRWEADFFLTEIDAAILEDNGFPHDPEYNIGVDSRWEPDLPCQECDKPTTHRGTNGEALCPDCETALRLVASKHLLQSKQEREEELRHAQEVRQRLGLEPLEETPFASQAVMPELWPDAPVPEKGRRKRKKEEQAA